VGIPDKIKELQEKLDTDTTLTEEQKTAITEEITLLNTQSQEIGESLKSNDLADMERYATVLRLAVDYADTNADYQKYVKTYEDKLAYAKDMVDYADLYEKSKKADGLTTAEKTQLDELKAKYGELYNSGAVKIDGQDAIIELNGAEFISNSNSFQINGLTINAKALTDEDEIITITTDTDVDAIYDKIKSFFKEYNELMTEMSTKYNAPSAGDYEPLTEAEEEELSETQLEKWEGILKTASLRRDGTLSTVMSSMKSVMIKSYQIDGKTYSLSSFGIKTAGYFTAEDNEKANYHIDGDPDDESSKANADKLKAALVADPENTIEFFSNIMKDLYKTLSDKLSKSTSTSSAFKIYNDKTMQSQYDSYTKKLSTWEDKIEDYRDKYVKKFSAMETAMAKLQSQTASLSSFFGTGM
jgi:flagellar hook-associated protein 2